MDQHKQTPRFRSQTNFAFETFVLVFTFAPVLLLLYFYGEIPEKVPEYLNLRGEVEVWGPRSFVSVFRLPLMAIDLQAVCLLAKCGAWQQSIALRTDDSVNRNESLKLAGSLFDWFRTFIAIKLTASSLEIVFYSVERFHYLTTITRATSWIASIIGVIGGIYFGLRLFRLERKPKQASTVTSTNDLPAPHNRDRGIWYYDPIDRKWFAGNRPNLGNKWLYFFVGCLLLLPLLMFGPMLF